MWFLQDLEELRYVACPCSAAVWAAPSYPHPHLCSRLATILSRTSCKETSGLQWQAGMRGA